MGSSPALCSQGALVPRQRGKRSLLITANAGPYIRSAKRWLAMSSGILSYKRIMWYKKG